MTPVPVPGGRLQPPLHRVGTRAGRVGFQKPIHARHKLKNIEPSAFPAAHCRGKGVGATLGLAAVLAAMAGAAAGAGAMVAKNLGLSHKAEQMEEAKKSGEKRRSEMTTRRDFLRGCPRCSAATAVLPETACARDTLQRRPKAGPALRRHPSVSAARPALPPASRPTAIRPS